jgi:hypothetical protein
MDMAAVDPASGGASQYSGAGMRGGWQPAEGQKFDPRHKSPVVAAVLSVLPGVGQLYIGYYVRGFAIAAAFGFAILIAGNSLEPVGPLLGMTAGFIWVFNIIDAGRMAAMYNHAVAGADVMEMPEDFKLPRMGGSIVGGAVLLVFGAIALSNTAFGYRLDWLEDWWPVFPLALGLYLFTRGVMDHMAQREVSATQPTGFHDDADDEMP